MIKYICEVMNMAKIKRFMKSIVNKEGLNVYCIRNNKVYLAVIVKENRKGNAAYCELYDVETKEMVSKSARVSYRGMYETIVKATNVLKTRQEQEKIRKQKEEEEENITDLIFRIYKEFGIKNPDIFKGKMTPEYLEMVYKNLNFERENSYE